MDINFQSQQGENFTIEVGFFDTVLEIKEKVQKYQGIPVSKQTLIFNGQILQDDHDIEHCELLHNSVVQLLTSPPSPESDKPQLEVDEPPQPKKIHLKINIPSSKIHLPPLDMDVNDTILRVKEKIHENLKSIQINKLIIQSNGVELQDHRSLRDYELTDNSEINVSIKSSPVANPGMGLVGTMTGPISKKLTLWVVSKCGTKKLPVEVNASDNVRELRKELQKLNDVYQFLLPDEEYFFIYNQNVMDDDQSFRWHCVGQGDTIEIFGGSITGGS